jgi:hypothetical protein
MWKREERGIAGFFSFGEMGMGVERAGSNRDCRQPRFCKRKVAKMKIAVS